IHLHRHVFELLSLSGTGATRGILKDTVLVPARGEAAVEFVADNPGSTLLHCHQQNHMDLGFMMVFRYA
ncbi:MAG: multicopper oxidase domain-containing protein, partial [Acidobacteria bacterium]|nr:multicopper oxidase domain-containing protein [Acidobacteriota bacterium]